MFTIRQKLDPHFNLARQRTFVKTCNFQFHNPRTIQTNMVKSSSSKIVIKYAQLSVSFFRVVPLKFSWLLDLTSYAITVGVRQ